MAARSRVTSEEQVPPEVVATVFHGVTVSDALAVMVVESLAGVPRPAVTGAADPELPSSRRCGMFDSPTSRRQSCCQE